MESNDKLEALIEAYLLGTLDGDELAGFEQMMRSDPELAERVRIMAEVSGMLDENSWHVGEFDRDNPKAKEYFEFFNENRNKDYLQELEKISVNPKTGKMNFKSILGLAGVAAIVVVGIILFNRKNQETPDHSQLYAEYASLDEVPSFTVRGATDSIINLIELQFQAKNFEDVNTLVVEHEDEFDEDQKSLMNIYQGISYGERGMYDQAYDVLDNTELFDNSIYSQMAEWYLGLALMKGDSDKRAKEIFMDIASNDNHYKQSEAKQILKRM